LGLPRVYLTDEELVLVKMGLLGLYSDETYVKEVIRNWLEIYGCKQGLEKEKLDELYSRLKPLYDGEKFDVNYTLEDIQYAVNFLLDKLFSLKHKVGKYKEMKLEGWYKKGRKERVKEILQEYDKVLNELHETFRKSS